MPTLEYNASNRAMLIAAEMDITLHLLRSANLYFPQLPEAQKIGVILNVSVL